MSERPFAPIAIVGSSCVLPGALDPDALWRAVREGRDLLSATPAQRWGLARERALARPGAGGTPGRTRLGRRHRLSPPRRSGQ